MSEFKEWFTCSNCLKLFNCRSRFLRSRINKKGETITIWVVKSETCRYAPDGLIEGESTDDNE